MWPRRLGCRPLLSASSAENEHGQGVARLVRRNPPVGSRRPVSPAEGVGRQGHPAESRVGRQALEETAPRARPDAPKVHADKHRARRVAGIDATGCRLDSQSVVRGLGHRLSGRDGHRVVLERYGVGRLLDTSLRSRSPQRASGLELRNGRHFALGPGDAPRVLCHGLIAMTDERLPVSTDARRVGTWASTATLR
jgi:hypothetical protein